VAVHEVETGGPGETEELGARLGAAAVPGTLVGLTGELGAGKTCLVRGLARGLGIDPLVVHSPTFVMATEYRGGRLPLHHVDLYRLEAVPADVASLREALYGDAVAAVEWFERFAPPPADEVLVVSLRYGTGDRRRIRLEARGPRHEAVLAAALGAP
jgi:tRNA threonylcarbamoyladenosine biosynthesis protein TsaE